MVDTPEKPGANGTAATPQPQSQAQPQVRIAAQYIKDLSFENPNVEKMLTGPGESPNIQVEVNVGAKRLAPPDLYESTLELRAQASSKLGVIYEIELVYGGMFEVKNLPQQNLEPFLLINCPTLLFPFSRRLMMDLTREAGYPPLMLDPIDFGALYVSRMQQQQAAGAGPQAANDTKPIGKA